MAIMSGGLVGMVTPTAEYAPYVNYGTRFQAAQPFISNAFNYQKVKFIAEMQRLVK
ncbi:HK97-gp10 family putative phage morphogenesis protein [Enterococcus avium]|nr:HK97-gp10 family putative phage morphogenesis protein [Enterococcus avium]